MSMRRNTARGLKFSLLSATLAVTAFTLIRPAQARDAATLRSDLASILPSGMKVRLAWAKGGNTVEFPEWARNTAIFVLDSDEGAIRRLYPSTGTGNFYNVHITADGSRVIFRMHDTKEIGVITWDGATFFKFAVNHEQVTSAWRDPADNSDWAIFTDHGLKKIKLDPPRSIVVVSSVIYSQALSTCGTKAAAFNYHLTTGLFGVVDVASGNLTLSNHGGCGLMAGGGGSNFKFLHNNSGHTSVCVHDGNNVNSSTSHPTATFLGTYASGKGFKIKAGDDFNTEGTRFANDVAYATTFLKNSSANPYLFRWSDRKAVHIEENVGGTWCGDMSAVILPKGPSRVSMRGSSAGSIAHGVKTSRGAYNLNGRYLGSEGADKRSSGTAIRGIAILKNQNGAITITTR